MFKLLKYIKFDKVFVESGNSYTDSLFTFYHLISMLLIFIVFLIAFWFIYILVNFRFKKRSVLKQKNLKILFKNSENIRYIYNIDLNDRCFKYLEVADIKDYPVLEATWSIIPIGFIGLVAYPSLSLEYGLSSDITPMTTLKVVANQWYWTFELTTTADQITLGLIDNDHFKNSETYAQFARFNKGEITSDNFYDFLIERPYDQLTKTINMNLLHDTIYFYRLLSVDSKLVLPVNMPIKLIVTSVDVLHSFALPPYGIKIDAIPGRLSEQIIICERPGIFWGQCSELCGPYHGFMPILIEVQSYNNFLRYLIGKD